MPETRGAEKKPSGGFYIYSLRNHLAASDRMIALERQARDDWQRKFEALQKVCPGTPPG